MHGNLFSDHYPCTSSDLILKQPLAKGVATEPESDPAMGAAVMRARCRLPAVSWPNDIYALATGPATGIALCLMWLDLAWRCSLLARDMLAGERALAPHSW